MNTFEVPLSVDEFNPALCFFSGQTFRWQHLADGSILGEEGAHWFRLSPHHESDHLTVSSNATSAAMNQLVQAGKRFDDIFRELCRRIPSVALDIQPIRGLRLLRPSSWQEPLFSFLCTSNNHLTRIQTMVRFLARHGDEIGFQEDRILYRFPSASQLAKLSEATLRQNGFGYRSATIPRVAQVIAEEGEDMFFERLTALPTSDLREELMKLPGVGRKLADCICLYAFHRDDSVPLDTHMWQAICRHVKPEWAGQVMTESRYREAQTVMKALFPEEAGWAHLLLYYENLLHWRKRRVAI